MEFILEFFRSESSPILQAFYAGLFTWILTAAGAALVFFFKSSNRKTLDAALGFTGGVMIAASFWSLLSPAINFVELQNELGQTSMPSFLPPAIGCFSIDRILLINLFPGSTSSFILWFYRWCDDSSQLLVFIIPSNKFC